MMQAAPHPMPDTFSYYHAAYLLAALLYAGYALSLWLRARGVRRRLHDIGGPTAGGRET